jgi:hypothetical protein
MMGSAPRTKTLTEAAYMGYLGTSFHQFVFFRFLHRRMVRYGLSSRWSIFVYLSVIFCLAITMIMVTSCPSYAQSSSILWDSTKWFDWSDYRFRVSGCGSFYRMESGTLKWGDSEFDLLDDYQLIQDTGPHISAMFQLYVDRLSLRLHVDTTQFNATSTYTVSNPTGITNYRWERAPELRLGLFRTGLDLDLIRYPSAAFGCNFDYQFSDVIFKSTEDATGPIPNVPQYIDLKAEGAMTLGLHGRVIPIRIRDVPFELQGRVRSSFFKRADQAWTIDWQIQGGLRPAIWDTSFFGHSTFSVSLQAGYRSTYLEFHTQRDNSPNRNTLRAVTAELTTHWHGPFAEIQFIY